VNPLYTLIKLCPSTFGFEVDFVKFSFRNVHFIDELASGLVFKPMSRYDGKLTPELTNHLFEDTEKPFSGRLNNVNTRRF
jgi:hypothetical protein